MKKLFQVAAAYVKTKYFLRFTSREQLEAWQEKKLNQHIRHVRRHSSFYRKHLQTAPKRLTLSNLSQLPSIDKTVMMDNFDALNTKGIDKAQAFDVAMTAEATRNFQPMIGDVTVGLSSGTSGNRGIFLVSEAEKNQWAGTILAKLLPEGLRTKETIAFFLRANSNLYESVTSRKISFLFFDLAKNAADHISRLNEAMPTILVAPPSLLRMLAAYKEAGALLIVPKKVISVAEVLDPNDECYLKTVFAQPVHQVYQCTEGFLAHTCSRGTLHLNEDIVIIEKEFLDEAGLKFSPVITDLKRRTQPIIRYRLNDILSLKKESCPCGSVMTALEQIEGRCDDIFYFNSKSGEQTQAVFPDFIRRAIITAAEEIEEYRVIQHTPAELEIQLKASGDVEEKVKQNVLAKVNALLTAEEIILPVIRFQPYQPQGRLQKLKRIERKLIPDRQYAD
ncbi:putative adenylate-forming enzyme [Evansella caseinilytica]|uniref:Putative adenylate-forming enzyme n=1 Tax=Evansella caseinilytica TaxID=1503961 RepID=A0A1H3IQ11_9BACI|nr:F390 synthetase-related protein [Evansella caseinilytica]SDY29188.1 putative adenylate-forming enzyme [Evansella caseinilytica]